MTKKKSCLRDPSLRLMNWPPTKVLKQPLAVVGFFLLPRDVEKLFRHFSRPALKDPQPRFRLRFGKYVVVDELVTDLVLLPTIRTYSLSQPIVIIPSISGRLRYTFSDRRLRPLFQLVFWVYDVAPGSPFAASTKRGRK